MTFPDPTPEGTQTVADLQRALAEARAEATLNRDRYLRARADMENFRKRVERQAADKAAAARRGLLLKMLGVMDNLDRAIQCQADAPGESDSLRTGLRLTYWQFGQLLHQEGLEPIAAMGQAFDPRLHEAIDTVVSAGQPEGIVVQETQKGYRMGDDVLRPARVVVSARPTADAPRAER